MKTNEQTNQPKELTYTPLNDNQKFYYCTDLGIGACLLCLGYELITVDTRARRAIFVFNRKNGIDKTVNEFTTGKLKVSARGLLDSVKALKNRLYSSL